MTASCHAVYAGRTPALAVWENVPGVLSTKDNAFGRFLGLLAGTGCALQPAGRRWANAGCVYGPTRAVAWRILDAQYFGVAQRRRRVFVVASAGGRDPAEVLFEPKELCGSAEPSSSQRQDIAGTLAAHSLVGGCSSRPAEAVGGLIIGQTDEHWIIRGNAVDRSPKNGGRGHDWSVGVVPTMTTTDRHAVAYSGSGGVRKLTPVECERLQGFPDDYTLVPFGRRVASDAQRYFALGNSMAVPVIRWLGERIQMCI